MPLCPGPEIFEEFGFLWRGRLWERQAKGHFPPACRDLESLQDRDLLLRRVTPLYVCRQNKDSAGTLHTFHGVLLSDQLSGEPGQGGRTGWERKQARRGPYAELPGSGLPYPVLSLLNLPI